MKSLEDLMDSCQKQKQALYAKIETLGEPDHNNEQSRKSIKMNWELGIAFIGMRTTATKKLRAV